MLRRCPYPKPSCIVTVSEEIIIEPHLSVGDVIVLLRFMQPPERTISVKQLAGRIRGLKIKRENHRTVRCFFFSICMVGSVEVDGHG